MRYINIFILALAIISCSKRSDETSTNPINENIQQAINQVPQISIMSIQSITKPNVGILMSKPYKGGYFVFQFDTIINLKPCRDFMDFPGVGYDTLDNDKDGVYNHTGVIFQCNKTDTIKRGNENYLVRYQINGYSFHYDQQDNDPYSFSITFGESSNDTFRFHVVEKKLNSNDSTIYYAKIYAKINSSKITNTKMKSSIDRKIYKLSPSANCEPRTISKDTIEIDFSNAPNWRPMKSLTQGQYLLIDTKSNADILTCDNNNIKMRLTTIEPIKYSVCPTGEDGPISGKLKLELPEQSITKYVIFNNCNQTISDN